MSEDDNLGSFEEYQGDSPDSAEAPENDDMAQNATGDVDTSMPDDLPETDDGLERVELKQEVDDLNERVTAAEEKADQLLPATAANPTGVDPVPGKWDLCFDRAKPGARVYVVDVLAESVEEYYESYPDAPALDTYEGNVLSRMRNADRVLAAIYVKDTLTSVSYQAYPMPESRLTRLPAEEADLVGNGTVEFARPPVEAAEEP